MLILSLVYIIITILLIYTKHLNYNFLVMVIYYISSDLYIENNEKKINKILKNSSLIIAILIVFIAEYIKNSK